MKVRHLCDKDQTRLEHRGSKPNGLWFSVDEAWKHHVLIHPEIFIDGANSLRYETEVILSSAARCCCLTTAADIDAITEQFANKAGATPLFDWTKFAKTFDAIIITPHCKERISDGHWYQPWDIACGCVWKADAATLRQLVPT